MLHTAYLTKNEQKLFLELPAALREGWDVKEETFTCYESLEQVATRMYLVDFTLHPNMKSIVERVKKNDFASITPEEIPSDMQMQLYFVMGARGVRSLMQTLMPEARNDEDLLALAFLSQVRQRLLNVNKHSLFCTA